MSHSGDVISVSGPQAQFVVRVYFPTVICLAPDETSLQSPRDGQYRAFTSKTFLPEAQSLQSPALYWRDQEGNSSLLNLGWC